MIESPIIAMLYQNDLVNLDLGRTLENKDTVRMNPISGVSFFLPRIKQDSHLIHSISKGMDFPKIVSNVDKIIAEKGFKVL